MLLIELGAIYDEIGQDNDMIDHIRVAYAENKIKLSWSIEPSTACNENSIGQQHDCSLHRKWNSAIMIDRIGCDLWWKPDMTKMWPMLLVQSMSKMKLSRCDRSDWVWSFTKKNRQHNDITDHIRVAHVKNETKLSWQIGIGTKCDENQIGQQCDR